MKEIMEFIVSSSAYMLWTCELGSSSRSSDLLKSTKHSNAQT